ncbi:MAG: Fic family protein [Planctomycetota bacterium]
MDESTQSNKPSQFRQTSDRAGRFRRQPTGYWAFVPAQLLPYPELEWDDELHTLLSKADRAVARLDGASSILPNADLFVSMYAMKEAVLSSQIEGTQATVSDVVAYKAEEAFRPADKHIVEVLNYGEAMRLGLEGLAQRPISTELLRQMHKPLLEGGRGREQRPGEIRQKQNWIDTDPNLKDLNRAKFVPPPPHEMNHALYDLQNFINDPAPLPILVRCALGHAQFETIHPFGDGNGRIGRMLITLMLCDKTVLDRPLLYLSYYFKQNKEMYYDALQRVRIDGDWEGWVKFFLKGVYEVGREATETAKKIIELRERDRSRLIDAQGRGAATALAVMESLFRRPAITVKQAAEVGQVSISAANRLVNNLVEMQMLEESTGRHRGRVFVYRDYLALFQLGTELSDPDTT